MIYCCRAAVTTQQLQARWRYSRLQSREQQQQHPCWLGLPAAGVAAGGCTTDALPAASQVNGMPLTDVLLVNIKLLTLPELKLITDQGADGRRQLSEAFSGASRLVSSLKRKSVIAEAADS
jgi:hypothetical protein